jgi:hypothetical protein
MLIFEGIKEFWQFMRQLSPKTPVSMLLWQLLQFVKADYQAQLV